ncbi:MAG: biotin--[Oscillospiraceae bacterium]|nr:biotin--[acetyl-CoA-carboxylase] ligase [Oscillospiraceae bacterium]
MKQEILFSLPGDHPWQNHIVYYDCIDSTNDRAKAMAKSGAPEGTVVVAGMQTAGRGRLGRTFHAPAGLGLYFSVILRPGCAPEQLMHLTCAAAVAACNAVEQTSGYRPRIKWTNDLVAEKQKLGGILTELSVNAQGIVEWAVIGIGINCRHRKEDFPAQLQDMATSLLQITGHPISPAKLAAELMISLLEMRHRLLEDKDTVLTAYRQDCMTLNRQVVLVRGDEKCYGTALDIDSDGSLVVRFEDGSIQSVQSGEISVRGLYGYA